MAPHPCAAVSSLTWRRNLKRTCSPSVCVTWLWNTPLTSAGFICHMWQTRHIRSKPSRGYCKFFSFVTPFSLLLHWILTLPNNGECCRNWLLSSALTTPPEEPSSVQWHLGQQDRAPSGFSPIALERERILNIWSCCRLFSVCPLLRRAKMTVLDNGFSDHQEPECKLPWNHHHVPMRGALLTEGVEMQMLLLAFTPEGCGKRKEIITAVLPSCSC